MVYGRDDGISHSFAVKFMTSLSNGCAPDRPLMCAVLVDNCQRREQCQQHQKWDQPILLVSAPPARQSS